MQLCTRRVVRLGWPLPLCLVLACGGAPRSATSPASSTTLTSARRTGFQATPWRPPPGPTEIPTLDQWAWRYPDAARELGEWIVAHRETARALAQWQERHPEQMEALVDWTTTHPYESLGVLFFDRAGWDELRQILGRDSDAEEFVAWIRRAPHAAREVAFYSNGLAFLDGRAGALLRSTYPTAGMRENPLFATPAKAR